MPEYQKYYDFILLIEELLQSYQKKYIFNQDVAHNIFTQCEIDIPRMQLFLNNVKCSDVYDLVHNISQYSVIKYYQTKNLSMLLMLLTTQAIFFYSYKFAYDLFQTQQQSVIDGRDIPNITINIENESIIIKLKKIYKIIDNTSLKTTERYISHTNIIINMIDIMDDPNRYCYGKKMNICIKKIDF